MATIILASIIDGESLVTKSIIDGYNRLQPKAFVSSSVKSLWSLKIQAVQAIGRDEDGYNQLPSLMGCGH